MADQFFSQILSKTIRTYGQATFELPIYYLRDDFFGLFFTANADKISAILPSPNLHPIILPNGKAMIAIAAYNYMETSIGSYGEVVAGIPCVYGKKPFPYTGVIAALLESKYPGFGILVHHLPVTKIEARDAGRGEWGYTKFIADMAFHITPEYLECCMHEETNHILTLRVQRKGIYVEDTKPITTYSVKNHQLIKTIIPQKGTKRFCLKPNDSFITWGNHPMAESIKQLDISEYPFMSIYYPERAAILPSGEIIETNVQKFDGYMGKDRIATHTFSYM